MSLTKLDFYLPPRLLDDIQSRRQQMDKLSEQLEEIGQDAGTDNPRFLRAKQAIRRVIESNIPLGNVLSSRMHVRALALTLNELSKEEAVTLDNNTLKKINHCINNKPTYLLIDLLFQYFLTYFEEMEDKTPLIEWLRNAKRQNGELNKVTKQLLNNQGPTWVAQEAVRKEISFERQVEIIQLDNYAEGSYIKLAKKHYFVEQLRTIPLNAQHNLLDEVKKESVYRSRYDSKTRLGHQVITILLERIYQEGTALGETWLKVILSIAGDPRVTNRHANYRDWWQFIDDKLKQLMITSLSKEDLRIFLEVIYDYARFESYNDEIKRMYPSRKRFLEGLLDAELIKGTRLYLSDGVERYLKKRYNLKELPDYSKVSDVENRSLIFIDLDGVKMIEGSHNCRLWLYRRLPDSACVFNYNRKSVNYRDLTSGLKEEIQGYSTAHFLENITHHPPLNWQQKTLKQLDKHGIAIRPEQVLSTEDYREFKQKYGVNGWK